VIRRRKRKTAGKSGAGGKISPPQPPRARSRSRHLFEGWKTVARRLRAAGRIALFLDFDGTLAPLRPHPKQVELDASTRSVLARLARHRSVTVFVVSGRRAADVRARVEVPGVCYVGLHGWERGERGQRKTKTWRFIERLRRGAIARLRGLEGIWVEDKFITFVVHYRRASPAVVRRARAILGQVLAPVRSKIRVMKGKKVWEILPLEVEGKGAAVRELLAELGGPAFPVYVGDDTTDEAAFEALPAGLTVRVGAPRRTHARFELRNPAEVREFLERLEAEIS
jgi:trehalose-phosphatase